MKVIVTGSREIGKRWANMPPHLRKIADIERQYVMDRLAALKPSIVIHGDCPKGADSIAKAWARSNGVPEKGYPAEWTLHGKRAGPIRNIEMLDDNLDADVVLAFPRGGGGTEHCMREAKKRRMVVHEH